MTDDEIHNAITAAISYSLAGIHETITSAILDAMPHPADICDAIKAGTYEASPRVDLVLEAIREGTMEGTAMGMALKGR